MVDAATVHTQGFLMKRKAEAGAKILQGIRRLELAVGTVVQLYHSNNAKKKQTKKLLCEQSDKDTDVTATAPHSSQRNNFFEKRFGSLFAAKKCRTQSKWVAT